MALEVTNQFILGIESFGASWLDALELPTRSMAADVDSEVILSPERSVAPCLMTLEGALCDRTLTHVSR